MYYRKYFSRSIKKNYPDTFELMQTTIDSIYNIISTDTEFASTSRNPMDKRLDFSAYFLALIQVLEKRGESFDQIRKICLEITTDYVKPRNRLQKWMKRLPTKLTNTILTEMFLKMMDRKIGIRGHPNGFVAKLISDKQETYGLGYVLDILECGICKLFKQHNAQKYSSILYEVDNLTSSLAGLELVRTRTIANGAEKCDFRFI